MIYISIGSNIGHRLVNIQNALSELKKNHFNISIQSPILETQAILPDDTPSSWNKPYLNMVIGGTISQPIEDFINTLQHIETILGREKPHPTWSPRIIDLDILLSDDLILDIPNLKIPHPELLNRDFLIHLLAMIAPQIQHPITHKNFAEISWERQKNHSLMIDCYDKSLTIFPKLVGIVNVSPDSFSDGGLYIRPDKAVQKALSLHGEGATIIEFGAQPTRPGATIIHPNEEYQRLLPVLEGLLLSIEKNRMLVGLDSFSSETVLKILNSYPLYYINDVKNSLGDHCLSEIARRGCKIVAMHSLTIPPDQQHVISLQHSPIHTILNWMEKKIAHLKQCGFSENQIILDPGIGFGKTPYQNLAILKNIQQLKSLNCEILVGHSRKSFINAFNHLNSSERDLETLAISAYLSQLEIDYLRVHNVAYHQRFLAVKNYF